jgi:hypothetical protein
MRTININWKVEYEGKDKIMESFGISAKEVREFLALFRKKAEETGPNGLTTNTLIELLEDGSLTGPIALSMIATAAQNM